MAVKSVASTRINEIRQEIEIDENKSKPKNGFKYAGFDSLKRPIKGVVPFNSADEAHQRLTVSGITVSTLSPVTSLKRKRDKNPSVIEMAQIADQFAAQKEIGLTYDRICRILGRVHPNLAVQRALTDIADRIILGQTAYEAFALQMDKNGKPFFPKTFINAFRIGDDVGALPDPETGESADAPVVMLRFFAQAQRKAFEMFKKIKTALIYPTSIMAVVFVAFFIEVYWIVPIFAGLFIGMLQGSKDTSLPLPTQMMLDVSDFFRSPVGWGITLFIFAGLGTAIYYYFFNLKGIEKRERLVLKLPIFKKFFLPFYASIFCRNLSMMWASEPNLAKRFQTIAETTTNPTFREMAEHIANQVPQGTSIGQYFNGYLHLLGESFAPVAETIENAPGEGQRQLYTYAQFLEQEAEEQLEWAIAVLGQVSFFLAAGMVVFILIASYSPLIQLVSRLAEK